MKYYIGIDGGATKTAICAANTDNSMLRYAKIAGSSWREHGASKVAKNLKEAIDILLRENSAKASSELIGGIAMGLPCYGESTQGDVDLEQAIHDQFAGIPVYFTNDVEVGWAGSMALEPGINIVAGTGAICFGKDALGNTRRCGGWHEFFGDEGSCYWVGRKVMELFSRQADGRVPKDQLYEIVRSELKLKDDISFIDIIHNEYLNYRKKVASLQLLAEKAAMAGSPSARDVYKEAVSELLLLVLTVRSQLDFPENNWNVSYSGGLFKAGDLVLPDFSREIEKEGGKVFVPRFKPAEGAVLLAFEHFENNGLERIKKIIKESKE